MANSPIDPTRIMAQHYEWQQSQEQQNINPDPTANLQAGNIDTAYRRLVQESIEAVLRNIGSVLPGK